MRAASFGAMLLMQTSANMSTTTNSSSACAAALPGRPLKPSYFACASASRYGVMFGSDVQIGSSA